jgi:hypothetical protein
MVDCCCRVSKVHALARKGRIHSFTRTGMHKFNSKNLIAHLSKSIASSLNTCAKMAKDVCPSGSRLNKP